MDRLALLLRRSYKPNHSHRFLLKAETVSPIVSHGFSHAKASWAIHNNSLIHLPACLLDSSEVPILEIHATCFPHDQPFKLLISSSISARS